MPSPALPPGQTTAHHAPQLPWLPLLRWQAAQIAAAYAQGKPPAPCCHPRAPADQVAALVIAVALGVAGVCHKLVEDVGAIENLADQPEDAGGCGQAEAQLGSAAS
jgi:hypothetical protein